MDHDDKAKESMESMFSDWMKSVADFWLSSAKTWPAGSFSTPESSQSSAADYSNRMQEGWLELLKIWQTSSSALSTPQTLESILKGFNALPEAAARILRTTWDGYFQLYQMWLKKAGKLGEASEAFSYEGLDPGIFKEWTAFYEKEIQPLFKAPQIGLTRFYQERVNEAMDKFNQSQVAITEFAHLLNLPVEKSMRVMEDRIEELAGEGKLSENFKDYYNMWIKILEGHYMTLYKSPEYVQSLSKTVNAVEKYKAAHERVLMDIIQFLPVPTLKDMDELYKEFYVLKKTVKEISKKVKKLEPSV